MRFDWMRWLDAIVCDCDTFAAGVEGGSHETRLVSFVSSGMEIVVGVESIFWLTFVVSALGLAAAQAPGGTFKNFRQTT